jgi:hypothetical protein
MLTSCWQCESASRPLVGIGELNNTTIKELIILLSIWVGIFYHTNGIFVMKDIESKDKRLIWQDLWLGYD